MYGSVLRKRLQLEASRQPFFLVPICRMPVRMSLSRHRQSSDLPTCTPSCKTCIHFYLYFILILAPGVPSSGCNRVLWVFGIFLGHKVIRFSTLITVVGAPVSFQDFDRGETYRLLNFNIQANPSTFPTTDFRFCHHVILRPVLLSPTHSLVGFYLRRLERGPPFGRGLAARCAL